MPKALYIDPEVTLRPQEHELKLPSIPVMKYNKTVKEEIESGRFSKEDLLRIFRDMSYIREFETMLNLVKTTGGYNGVPYNNPGPAHLSAGQEAAAVGMAYALDTDDFIFGSHRSHGEILAKGLRSIQILPDEELKKGDFVTVEINDSHEGVLGIVAGKLREKINRPVVVISRNKDIYKGTGRSIPTVDLFSMLDKYRSEFISFGGHSAACGFTISADKADALRENLNADIARMLKQDESLFDTDYGFDAEVDASDVTLDLAEAVTLLECFAEKGSVLAVSDAGAGAAICAGALKAASLNVFINTGSMKNRETAEAFNARADVMLEQYLPRAEAVYQDVFRRVRT